jgi:hypothetical protein
VQRVRKGRGLPARPRSKFVSSQLWALQLAAAATALPATLTTLSTSAASGATGAARVRLRRTGAPDSAVQCVHGNT